MSEEENQTTSDLQKFRNDWEKERVKPFKGQNFYEIRQKLLTAEELFEDPEFPPSNKLLDEDSSEKEEKVEWLRPSEIVSNPKFSVNNFSRFDVAQGGLGDCWFVAAITALVDNKKFFNRVVCYDNSFDKDYAGIFHFRFWKFGEWIDVVVDDQLPVDKKKKLIYLTSQDGNEFWSALLEKAFAKFRGDFGVIDLGGYIELSFQNLTGGIMETYNFTDTPQSALTFFNTKLKKNALLGCGIDNARIKDDEMNLPPGHQYTITGTLKYKNFFLIRIRNPWGNATEWNGAWSDESEEWKSVPDDIKNDIGLKKEDDGEFWMNYKDFVKYFADITICNLSPDENAAEKATKKWEKSQFKGEWIAGITAGGSSDNKETYHMNPQYLLTLDEPGDEDDDGLNSVVIALLQKEVYPKKDFLNIHFNIYKITDDDEDDKPMTKTFFEKSPINKQWNKEDRQEIYARIELLPGKYLIVPSIKDVDVEGEYLIRAFVDNKFKFEPYEKQNKFDRELNTLKQLNEMSITKLLYLMRTILGERKEESWKFLKDVLDGFIGSDVASKHFCRSAVAMATNNNSKRMDLEEFEKVIKDILYWTASYKATKFTLEKNDENLSVKYLSKVLEQVGINLDNQILNCLAYTYGTDKKLTLDDFLMCCVKAKMFIEHFSDDELRSMDVRTMRALF